MDLIEAVQEAGDEFVRLSETVAEADLANVSTCDGWSIGGVIEHVVAGCRMTVALVDGATADEALAVRAAAVGDPIVDCLRMEVDRQYRALAQPPAELAVVHYPLTDMTLTQLGELRLVEFVVHGWDLARSTGADDAIDERHARLAWAAIAPLADVTGSLGVFGAGGSGTLDDEASPALRLLDATGRRP